MNRLDEKKRPVYQCRILFEGPLSSNMRQTIGDLIDRDFFDLLFEDTLTLNFEFNTDDEKSLKRTLRRLRIIKRIIKSKEYVEMKLQFREQNLFDRIVKEINELKELYGRRRMDT